MFTSRRFLSLFAVVLWMMLAGPAVPAAVTAQTPGPEGCPAASADENIALVQELQTAVANGDADTIDRILADDYTHNQNRYGLPDDPTSNADEIELALRLQEFYAGSTHTVTDVLGTENKVVVESVWTISQHSITGETVVLETPIDVRSISVFTIECGEVVSLNTVLDELALLIGLGVVPPLPIMQGTPIPAAVTTDASPDAASCPATTVDENVALVAELHAAVETADADTIDRILADDYAHNQNRYGLPDDPTSNADEIELALRLQEFYAGSSREVTDIYGVDNRVVVESVWTVTQHSITGETVVLDTPIQSRSIAIFTVECGEVVSLNVLADELTLLIGLGVIPPLPIMQATPAA